MFFKFVCFKKLSIKNNHRSYIFLHGNLLVCQF